MTELTAIGKYVNYWWPHIPAWVSVLVFFAVITLANLANVKLYAESEFWLSMIKVLAIVAMIIFGGVFAVDGKCRFIGIDQQFMGAWRLLPEWL